jgi:hypothetical protein
MFPILMEPGMGFAALRRMWYNSDITIEEAELYGELC